MRTREYLSDRGSGTVAAIGLAAAVVAIAALLAPVAGIATARHRAASAADAAALAGAAVVAGLGPDSYLGTGSSDDPCAVAADLAARHGAAIDSCAIGGLIVTVRAVVGTAFGPVAAAATAGPPDSR